MSTIDLSLMPLAAREFRLRNVLKEVEGSTITPSWTRPPRSGSQPERADAAHDLFVPCSPTSSPSTLKLETSSVEETLQHCPITSSS